MLEDAVRGLLDEFDPPLPRHPRQRALVVADRLHDIGAAPRRAFERQPVDDVVDVQRPRRLRRACGALDGVPQLGRGPSGVVGFPAPAVEQVGGAVSRFAAAGVS